MFLNRSKMTFRTMRGLYKKNRLSSMEFKREMSSQVYQAKGGTVGGILWKVFGAAIPAGCFGLAYWQYQRLYWKLNLIEETNRKIKKTPPQPLPIDLSEITQDYVKYTLEGEFDHSREMFISPREPVQGQRGVELVGAETGSGGAFLVTPFKLKDREETVLINRGWLPKGTFRPERRQDSMIKGNVKFIGVHRFDDGGAKILDLKTISEGLVIFIRKERKPMAEHAGGGTLPIYFEADEASTVKNGPLGGQTKTSFRNKHKEYILTWSVLGLLFLWGFIRSVRPRKNILRTDRLREIKMKDKQKLLKK